SLFYDTQQMWNLCYSTTHRVSVWTLDNLVQLSQTKTAHYGFMCLRRCDEASIVLDSNLSLIALSLSCTCHASKLLLCVSLRSSAPSALKVLSRIFNAEGAEDRRDTQRKPTSPRPAYHANAPVPSDLSCVTERRTWRAQRCVD